MSRNYEHRFLFAKNQYNETPVPGSPILVRGPESTEAELFVRG
jgi:hypothetical protein